MILLILKNLNYINCNYQIKSFFKNKEKRTKA